MAEKKFLVDLNLGGNKAKNFRLEDYASSSAPTSNFVGRMIYTTNGTAEDRLELYTASGWQQVAYLSDAPVLDQDLVDIAALTGDGVLVRQSGVWAMDNTNYVTLNGVQTLTNKTINDTLYFTNPSTTPNDGSLVINDTNENFEITALTGNLNLGATGTGKSVVLSGVAGEFLNDPSDPNNQIATIGDINAEGVNSIQGTANQISVSATGEDGTGDITLSIPSTLKLGIEAGDVFTLNSSAKTFTLNDPTGLGTQIFQLSESDTNAVLTASTGSLNLNSTNAGVFLNADSEIYATAATDITLDAAGSIFLKDNGTEFLELRRSGVGTAQIRSTDDISIRSSNGDILFYPGNESGGIGKVYIGWGNANPDTAYGIANPGNEVITVDYVTGFTNTLSAQQFRADLIDSGENYYGGYSFKNDGGYDTGMFSNGDGLVSFFANAEEVAHFNQTTFTVDKDLVVTGDLTVNGTLTTLNTETVTVEDNILVLNGNVTGTPLTNAGLEIERGDYTNASLLWNETDNNWTVSTVKDSTAAAVTHSIARKYSETLTADPAATSFVVTHNLNTRDVIAQVYTVASPYEQVEVAIEYTSVDTITLKLNAATTGDYRVVVTG